MNFSVQELINELNKTNIIFTEKLFKDNRTLTGIMLKTAKQYGEVKAYPCVYAEYFEDMYPLLNYQEIALEIINMLSNATEMTLTDELEFNYAKDNLILCIEPAGDRDYVTIPYLDLQLYFRVKVVDETTQRATYKVNEELLNKWKITKEELLQVALEAQTYVKHMSSPFMSILTNEDTFHGASIIFNKEYLEKIAEMYEDDLIIMPSSIHEILASPSGIITLEEATCLVQSVNMTEVKEEERLSNHAYYYRRATKEIVW